MLDEEGGLLEEWRGWCPGSARRNTGGIIISFATSRNISRSFTIRVYNTRAAQDVYNIGQTEEGPA